MKHACLALSILAGHFIAAARADDVTLESVPPVVVKTVPQAGAADVDPAVTEIKVIFSKDMTDKSWSWVTLTKETFPNTTGMPKYLADKRTCVLPVKLEAGRTYAVWVNSERFDNFKDADGHAAVPYLLTFKTKGKAVEKPPEPPRFTEETLGRAFNALWAEMDRHYSYFASKKHVDWNALKDRCRPRAVKAKDRAEFVAALKELLAPLKDLHVWIETPDGAVGTYRSGYTPNRNREAVLALLEDQTECGFAVVGKTRGDGFGYFLMVSQGHADDADVRKAAEAIDRLHDAPGFIVDLRDASGGDERKARQIAQHFCGRDVVYARSKFRDGPGHDQFTAEYERVLKASPHAYTRPVVCLIGPGAVSSGEAFVQMMKCLPHVTTVGLPTRGASGNPRPFELPGLGIKVWFSRWVDLMPDGSTFEGVGIRPDVIVDRPAEEYIRGDPTLEKGLEVLREKR